MTATLDRQDLDCFRTMVGKRLGLHFDDGKLDLLAEVLRRRMEDTGCQSFCSYRQHTASPRGEHSELRALAAELTVSETYFFRYAEHFQAFADVVIPDRLRARQPGRPLRILSAGCASGEEAYSLAMLLRERLPELAPSDIPIQGIDVNPAMLAKAARARYPAWSLRETPADLRARYFRAEGREFLLDPSVQSAVSFEERNLVEEDPRFWQRGTFDLVFCRNVIMYLAPQASQAVIARIANSLEPGGFLFLGHAETLRGLSQEFHLRHTHGVFYYQRRNPEEEPEPDSLVPSGPASSEEAMPRAVPEAVQPSDSWFDIIQRASARVASLTGGDNGAPRVSPRGASSPGPVASPHPPQFSWDSTLALALLREEKFAEARELLRALPPESHGDADTQLLLAGVLTSSGDLIEAEQVCRHVLHLDELNAGAHYLMALCREHAGDARAATEHDRAAMYLDAAFAMPHLHLGLAAKRSGDFETARRELHQALPLLAREEASRILLFGGGFRREALAAFCQEELRTCGGPP